MVVEMVPVLAIATRVLAHSAEVGRSESAREVSAASAATEASVVTLATRRAARAGRRATVSEEDDILPITLAARSLGRGGVRATARAAAHIDVAIVLGVSSDETGREGRSRRGVWGVRVRRTVSGWSRRAQPMGISLQRRTSRPITGGRFSGTIRDPEISCRPEIGRSDK